MGLVRLTSLRWLPVRRVLTQCRLQKPFNSPEASGSVNVRIDPSAVSQTKRSPTVAPNASPLQTAELAFSLRVLCIRTILPEVHNRGIKYPQLKELQSVWERRNIHIHGTKFTPSQVRNSSYTSLRGLRDRIVSLLSVPMKNESLDNGRNPRVV